MSNIYHMEDYWNGSGVVFSAIRMNVTDIQSNNNSKLISLEVDDDIKFAVLKDGTIFPAIATSGQGALADSAIQPGANITLLNNNANYISEIPTSLTWNADGFNGNLAPGDDTLQKVFNKVDDIVSAITSGVSSINGYSGAVTLTYSDVGAAASSHTQAWSTITNKDVVMESGDLVSFLSNDARYLASGDPISRLANDVPYLAVIPSYLQWSAAGFSGNLTTGDDTLQEVFNKVDILIGAGSSGVLSVDGDTGPYVTLDYLSSGDNISLLNNNVPYLSSVPPLLTWNDASFSGNLAPGDDTLQEIFDKVDNFVTGVSSGVYSVNNDTGPHVTLIYSDVGAAPTVHTHDWSDITGEPVFLEAGDNISLLNNNVPYLTSGVWASKIAEREIMLVCSDETTEIIASGDPYLTFYMPFNFQMTGVYSSCNVAPTGGYLTYHLQKDVATNLGIYIVPDGPNYISIADSETIPKDSRIDVYVTGVGPTYGGAGLKVTLLGYKYQ